MYCIASRECVCVCVIWCSLRCSVAAKRQARTTTWCRTLASVAAFFDHLSNLQLLAALAHAQAHAPLAAHRKRRTDVCTHALVVAVAVAVRVRVMYEITTNVYTLNDATCVPSAIMRTRNLSAYILYVHPDGCDGDKRMNMNRSHSNTNMEHIHTRAHKKRSRYRIDTGCMWNAHIMHESEP